MTKAKSQIDWAIDWWLWDRKLSYARHMGQSFLPVHRGNWHALKEWSRLERLEHWVKARGLKLDLWQTQPKRFAYTVTTDTTLPTDGFIVCAGESNWVHLATIGCGQYVALDSENEGSLDDHKPVVLPPVEAVRSGDSSIEGLYRCVDSLNQTALEFYDVTEENDHQSLKEVIRESYERAIESVEAKPIPPRTHSPTKGEVTCMYEILKDLYSDLLIGVSREIYRGNEFLSDSHQLVKCASTRDVAYCNCGSCLKALFRIQSMVERNVGVLMELHLTSPGARKALQLIQLDTQRALFAIRLLTVHTDFPENRDVTVSSGMTSLRSSLKYLHSTL